MHILFLTQIIPYPPDAGPKVKTWHVLRYLVERGHEVTLASFVRPEERRHIPILESLCAAVHTVPIRRSRLADAVYWLRSLFSGRPFLVERDDLAGMRVLVRELLAAGQVDIIHADQLTMTQFALPYSASRQDMTSRPSLVFDAHNAVWTITRRMAETAPWFLKPVLWQETARIERYEGMVVGEFDHTLAVTEPDRRALIKVLKKGGDNRPAIHVIPIAVDTLAQKPVERQRGSKNILTLGTLHYPPNADGIRWFLQEVFPLVRDLLPGVSLTIVGKNPPRDFREEAAQLPGVVRVTGYVPDLQPVLAEAGAMVVPVRAGGGMRVRILEAFAHGMPVITTTVGLEGIEAEPGRDVLVADTPGAFASAVVQVLTDPAIQEKLSTGGRLLAETSYDWQIVLDKLDAVYHEISDLRKHEHQAIH
jgi:glycosyltransferase involved in cell wall biosynthesis